MSAEKKGHRVATDWFDTRQKHTRASTASEAVVQVQTTRRDGRDTWVRGCHATAVAAVFGIVLNQPTLQKCPRVYVWYHTHHLAPRSRVVVIPVSLLGA